MKHPRKMVAANAPKTQRFTQFLFNFTIILTAITVIRTILLMKDTVEKLEATLHMNSYENESDDRLVQPVKFDDNDDDRNHATRNSSSQYEENLLKMQMAASKAGVAERKDQMEEDYDSNNEMNNQLNSELNSGKERKQQQLQFLHIAKTGGSAITEAGMKGNIAWAYCRFQTSPNCPDLPKDENGKSEELKKGLDKVRKLNLQPYQNSFWHYPPSTLRKLLLNHTSEMNIENEDEIIDPYEDSDLFVVVRNPYDRLISAYYHWNTFRRFPGYVKLNSAEMLNQLVARDLDLFQKDYLYRGGHYIPQYDFVYDTSGDIQNMYHHHKRVVKHVLRYENMEEDFDKLMKQYNLNITLGNRASATRKRRKQATMKKEDFSFEIRQRIEDVYANDFKEFGYPMMSTTSTRTKR